MSQILQNVTAFLVFFYRTSTSFSHNVHVRVRYSFLEGVVRSHIGRQGKKNTGEGKRKKGGGDLTIETEFQDKPLCVRRRHYNIKIHNIRCNRTVARFNVTNRQW